MTTPLDRALDQARTDWLAGDAAAWARYLVCVRGTLAADRVASPCVSQQAAKMAPRRRSPRAKA